MTPQELDNKIKYLEDELILAAFHGHKLDGAEGQLKALYKLRDAAQ